MVSLIIDGKEIRASRGKSVLWSALENGIYIPNLCAIRGAEPPSASCRLCFVGVRGYRQPVTACTEPVREGMVVDTRRPDALRLARSGFDLIMASHPIDCARCAVNGSCELQEIAHHLGVSLKTRRLRKLLRGLPVDSTSPLFVYDPNKCVLCGRCVWACRHEGIEAIGFVRRGFARMVSTFGDGPIGESGCRNCGKCVAVCPAGALTFKPPR